LSRELSAIERELLDAGHRVSAEQLYQQRTGCTVEDARAAVEAAKRSVRIVKKGDRLTRRGPRGGCLG